MKVIFLDVDGVLNCAFSRSRCGMFTGIDSRKVKALRQIVEQTGARLVLTSTWKEDWQRLDKESQTEAGDYLDRKLKRERLALYDKTEDYGRMRGKEIREWLARHPGVEAWVVLDDEIFEDYEEQGILGHLVRTVYEAEDGGLQQEHVRQALELLG